MWWTRGGARVAADPGFVGAVVGFVVSVVVFAVLMGLAFRIDRGGRSGNGMGCTCLLRMAALLVLTLGLGAGYIIGRMKGG